MHAMARHAQRLQLTLAVLKPDVIARPHHVQEIRKLMLDSNFLFVRSKLLQLSRSQAENFYEEHRNRFFFNRLVSYMSSGPLGVHILAREDAIHCWRDLMGPTRVFRAIYTDPDTIRGRYGLTDTRNSSHGSDSEESAKREIGFFFKDFDYTKWCETEEPLFRCNEVMFDPTKYLHVVKDTHAVP